MDDVNKNFGLSNKEFDKLVVDLKTGSNQLFENIFLSHFGDCISYVERKYTAHYNDAYDATMDAALDFRLRLVDGKIKYGNMKYLFTKMATQCYLRNIKKFQTQEICENDVPEPDQVDENDIIILQKAWKSLGAECQSLLGLNFYSNMKLSAIAVLKEKPATAIRKQKERCLNKLYHLFSRLANQQ